MSGYTRYPQILTFDEAFKDNDDRNNSRGLKLLTLYGNTNGDLQWKINQYKDGSGHSNKTIIPFISYDAAKEYAFKIMDQALEKFIKDDTPSIYDYNSFVIDFSLKHGYIIPEHVKEHVETYKLKATHNKITELEAQIAALKQ